MKAALFTDSDVFAGTERHMLDLAFALRERGEDVSLACPAASPLAQKAAAADFAVTPIEKNGLVDWAAVRVLVRLLRSGRVDLIHSHNGRTALVAALAVTLARTGTTVATQHFLEPNHATQRGLQGRASAAAHRWVSRQTEQFIAISHAVRQEMERRGESQPAKITVVPNGLVPPNPAHLTPAEKVRAEFGIASDAPLLVCAARLEREKDVASLIAAMIHVREADTEAVCLVAGEGTQREVLTKQIQDAHLEAQVRLLGFWPDALSLINACDLFVLPSLAEPFGLVLLEAMALGKPVIATAAGGPLEIVVPDITGLLVPPGQPEALARAILQMLSQRQAMKTLGSSGLDRFCSRFTAARMAQETQAVYQKAIKKK